MSEQEEQSIIAELDAQFGAEVANIPERTSDQLPKMKCALQIESAYLNKSQTSGRKQLTIAAVILESDAGDEFVGKKYKKNWGLETAENWSWLKKDVRALELEPPSDPKQLLALCGQLQGLSFSAQLTPNQDDAFPPNCYINKGARRHDLEGGASPGSGSGAASL